MVRVVGRKLLWVYALLLLLAAIGYARYDLYTMDGDGTAFLDIAQGLNSHHAALAINGYWNPGYPAVIAAGERVAHPSLWRELVVLRFTNVVLFALAMAATVWFTSALVRARHHRDGDRSYALAPATVHLLGLGLLTLSLGRELPIAAPRADTLLFALLLLAAGLLLQLFVRVRVWLYPVLGAVLGCAYLTKSFAFLPSIVLLLGLLLFGLRTWRFDKRPVFGAVACLAVFFAVAGPYILAISRQLGHFSTGESARLNYAFFVDLTPRWHEWYRHDLGHAGGVFLHPEQPVAVRPPVFSFAAHPEGTFPLWFDPAWWTLGIKPHFWLKGHVLRLARNLALLLRYLLARPEPIVLLAVLLAFGVRRPGFRETRSVLRSRWSPWVTAAWWAVPFAWGLLMLAIYLPVDLQDRYLTAPFFLMLLPWFAALRDEPGRQPAVQPVLARERTFHTAPGLSAALVVLFAGMILAQSVTYLADRRRHTPPAEQHHPGYDPQIFTAAAGLRALGVRPGDKLACMGDLACYTDHYWARLAGAQILGEVTTPNEANPLAVWDSISDKQSVVAPLRQMGLRYLVSLFPNSGSKPEGWIQLGGSNFFAYPLQGPVSPAQAARVADLRATP